MDSYQVLVINPDLPIKSVAELTAYGKANAGKLNYGAAGPANLTNLAGELYKLKAGLDFVAVHFKSGAESLTCVLGGQCQFTIDNVTAVRALIDDKKLRPLAVTSAAPAEGLSRSADHDRGGRAGLRGDELLRRGGARRHARADRRAPQRA